MKRITAHRDANTLTLRWRDFERSHLLGLFWVFLWLVVSVSSLSAMRAAESARPIMPLLLLWGLLGATFLPITLKGILNRTTITLTLPSNEDPFRDPTQKIATLLIQKGPLHWKRPIELHLKKGDTIYSCDEADNPNEWTAHRVKVRLASQEEVVLLRELPSPAFAAHIAKTLQENILGKVEEDAD